ncbi:TetR/AcrR family transcriptional regulator [Salipaludibacillus agaradhaerens]|uniref:TetR/AcrR family transcriptional regulator n=1 Tax=Salipaludibacillus agaradhaerens TaxID=76935 RepID=A0A9Q4FZR6_SALAG|nr:TetR/AcrR family transcriptional regulator [Salipaludibacillus agaradhaerens]MCR6097367.1 TetR/AcrR family transcriptional regulator [Salipaludibacillus agaradhaerens]MCR6113148.1 TetR/AcrR family transcriptional regulator [Salipaludibacillus agaradhaerens]
MKTSEQLLHVALQHFAEHGYEGASLARMADEVGIKKASIYNHYQNKDALFFSAVEYVYEAYLNYLKSSLETNKSLPTEDRLYMILEDLSHYLSTETEGKFYFHFILFPPPALEKNVHAQFLQFEKECDKLLAPLFQTLHNKHAHQTTVRERLDAFYCLLDGLATQMSYYDKETCDRKRQSSWKHFIAGFM